MNRQVHIPGDEHFFYGPAAVERAPHDSEQSQRYAERERVLAGLRIANQPAPSNVVRVVLYVNGAPDEIIESPSVEYARRAVLKWRKRHARRSARSAEREAERAGQWGKSRKAVERSRSKGAKASARNRRAARRVKNAAKRHGRA